ncbi:MAG: heat-inducible transcription repressor HrcA [Proteobacteria bacterium]|nr:heat-inducible transcription repressor HrcA [Pseudomonadota bacterium]
MGTIINDFIVDAEPVSSAKVSKKKGVDLSSASIRQVMSGLEEAGYLMHPHTSAGRVPTEKAYRYYINSLLQMKGLSKGLRASIEEKISWKKGINDSLMASSKLLSVLSHQAGIVMKPRVSNIIFKHIRFVPIGSKRLIAIMVSQTGVVINKTFEIEEDLKTGELEKINNYLNTLLEGLSIDKVKEKIFREMKEEKALYNKLLSKALKFGKEMMKDQGAAGFYMEGATNFLNQPEFADIESMKRIFSAFEEKSILLKLLDESIRAEGLNIYIGDEIGIKEMEGMSLITYPYGAEGRPLGCIGVIGPTRMDYSMVIPIVEYTGDTINRIIREA